MTLMAKSKLSELRERNRKRAWKFVSQYCDSTTIHGLKYLGERKRSWLERIFWVLVFVASIYGCIKLILLTWEKWETNPVIVSFDDKSTLIKEIPFPAVTICPGIKIDYINNSSFNYTDILYKVYNNQSVAFQDLQKFSSLSFVCENSHFDSLVEIPKLDRNGSVCDDLLSVRTYLDRAIEQCLWKNEEIPAEDLWTEVLTYDGICYTFNSIGVENIMRNHSLHGDFHYTNPKETNINWSLDTGYDKNTSSSFPRRVIISGHEMGLTLILIGETINLDQNCGLLIPGFKLVIHPPNELPDLSKSYVRIPFGQNVMIGIKPSMRSTVEGLKSYQAKYRQCYFNSERYLMFFKNYTQNNCEIECLANYTLRNCDCVDYYQPHLQETPICKLTNDECTVESYREMEFEEAENGICDCLPACTEISYDTEVSSSDGNMEFSMEHSAQIASMTLFFKEDQFWTSKRSELYGTIDFIANCGGILGLFMGVSVLSVIEFLYFLIFRLPRYIREEFQNEKKVRDCQ